MDILMQISAQDAIAQANNDRLKEVFTEVTAATGGLMRSQQFSDAVLYPLRQSVVDTIYERHFQSVADKDEGLTKEMFIHAVSLLENIEEKGFNNIIRAHENPNGMVSFESFKDILAVFLMQQGIVICNSSIERLAEIILLTRKATYQLNEIENSVKQWEGLRGGFRDILSCKLFVTPLRVRPSTVLPLNRHRTDARKLLLIWCLIVYLLINVLCTIGAFLATNDDQNAKQNSKLLAFERWTASVKGVLRRVEDLNVSEYAADLTRIPLTHFGQMGSSIIAELLNLHVFLAAAAGLRAIQISLKRSPWCRHATTRDGRSVMLFLCSVLLGLAIVDCVLSACTCTKVRQSGGFFVYSEIYFDFDTHSELDVLIQSLEGLVFPIKYTLLAVHLLFELRFMGKQVTEVDVGLSDALYCGFLILHLIQSSSFFKWSVVLLLIATMDHFVYRRCCGLRSYITQTKWCTTSGALLVSLRRDEDFSFRPGDFVLLTINGLTGNSVVPSWIISAPSDKSEVTILLEEDHWQSRTLTGYLRQVRSAIRNANDKYIKDSLIGRGNSAGGPSADRYTRRRLDSLMKDMDGRPRDDVIILFEDRTNQEQVSSGCRHRNTVVARLSQSLQVTIYGAYTGVQFDLYSRYNSIMLCITRKSVGAVTSFIEDSVYSSCGRQSLTLILAVTDLSGIEWFVEKLVQMELHQVKGRGGTVARNCLFVRIYLTKASSLKKMQVLLTSLAVAAMASYSSKADNNGRYRIIQECRKMIRPAISAAEDMKDLEPQFKDLGILLCDGDFAYGESFLSKARHCGADVELRRF